jgi:4-amino-4-deoxy-L-arabinose transferase-like glycosyltransferase
VGSQVSKKLLICIVALAFGTRFAVAMLTTSWVFPNDDNGWHFGYEMGQIAASLAMGNGFSWPDWFPNLKGPTSWMAPGYPLIMAGAFKVFGIFSMQAAIALEFFLTIMSALSCIFLFLLGKRLYNAQVGLLAAFILAIYPPSIHYAIRNLWDTSLYTCCMLLIILMLLKLADQPNIKKGIALGLMLGFTALVNPIIIGVYPFAFAWLYLRADGTRKTIINTIALMLITFSIVISPWLGRNYITFGQFTFIKSNFGKDLFMGIKVYENLDRADVDNESRNTSLVITDADQEVLVQSNEASRSSFLLWKALVFIGEHPLRFTKLVMIRFARFWTYMRLQDGLQAKISLTIYLVILTLAVAGLLLTKASRRDVQLVLLFLLVLPSPYYFTFTNMFRYRFPTETILILFASFAIQRLLAHPASKNHFAEVAQI